MLTFLLQYCLKITIPRFKVFSFFFVCFLFFLGSSEFNGLLLVGLDIQSKNNWQNWKWNSKKFRVNIFKRQEEKGRIRTNNGISNKLFKIRVVFFVFVFFKYIYKLFREI